MTAEEIVAQLQKLGSEGTAKVLRKHGAHDPCLGVKIGDMKPLQKQIKKTMGYRWSSTIPAFTTLCILPD